MEYEWTRSRGWGLRELQEGGDLGLLLVESAESGTELGQSPAVPLLQDCGGTQGICNGGQEAE